MTPAISTTLGALVTAEPALAAIGALKLPAKSAYHLMKLRALVAIETQHFHVARDGYIKEWGTARDSGFAITPDSPHWPAFVRRHDELAAVPVEIHWRPLTLDLFDDEKVSAADLAALGPLFAEPEPQVDG